MLGMVADRVQVHFLRALGIAMELKALQHAFT